MKKTILFTVIVSILFAGCAGVNPLEGTGEAFGFFSGLWDGLTAYFSFLGKMFGADMNIYEVANNGNWYNFGFLIGMIFSLYFSWFAFVTPIYLFVLAKL